MTREKTAGLGKMKYFNTISTKLVAMTFEDNRKFKENFKLGGGGEAFEEEKKKRKKTQNMKHVEKPVIKDFTSGDHTALKCSDTNYQIHCIIDIFTVVK